MKGIRPVKSDVLFHLVQLWRRRLVKHDVMRLVCVVCAVVQARGIVTAWHGSGRTEAKGQYL